MLKFEYWENERGEYNFHLIHKNGQILMQSNQGYKNKGDMVSAIQTIKEYADKAFIQRRED